MRIGALDLGGTNVKLAIFDENLNRQSLWEVPAQSVDSVQALLAVLKKHLGNAEKIGVSVAGSVDAETGAVFFSPNIKWLNDVNLKNAISAALNVPVEIENDANCFVLGESRKGVGIGFSRLVGFTLGTGVGCGIIIENKLLRGVGIAELGHIVVDRFGLLCNCGKNGCLEAYIGGAWAARFAEMLIPDYALKVSLDKEQNLPPKRINEIEDEKREFVRQLPSTKDFYELATAGDPFALHFFKIFGEYLGLAMAEIVNILRPQAFILGGKIANAFRFFYPSVVSTLRKEVFPPFDEDLKILPAKLTNAGLVGAASLQLK